MSVVETERLNLRELTVDDAEFMFELLNDPGWLRFIGDRGVRSLAQAREYIESGPIDSYRQYGFGLFLVERKDDGSSIGICGLIRRPSLEDVDLGFALLPAFRGAGYVTEASRAVLEMGTSVHRLERIVAITSPDNHESIRALDRLGFEFEESIGLDRDDDDPVNLYAWRPSGGAPALRPASADDREFVKELSRSGLAVVGGAVVDLTDDTADSSIVRWAGEDVGVVVTRGSEERIEIASLYLRPEHDGIATTIVSRIVEDAHACGLMVRTQLPHGVDDPTWLNDLGFTVVESSEAALTFEATG